MECGYSDMLTCDETDPPEAGVNGHAHVSALVKRQYNALLQVKPVVSTDSDTQQTQTAYCKHAAQQGQSLPPARTHANRRRKCYTTDLR